MQLQILCSFSKHLLMHYKHRNHALIANLYILHIKLYMANIEYLQLLHITIHTPSNENSLQRLPKPSNHTRFRQILNHAILPIFLKMLLDPSHHLPHMTRLQSFILDCCACATFRAISIYTLSKTALTTRVIAN